MSFFIVRTCRMGAKFTPQVLWRALPLTGSSIQRNYHPPSTDAVAKSSKVLNKYGDEIPVLEDVPQMPTLPEVVPEASLESYGLCGNHPSGFIQQALEFLHVSADMPWWGAIATGTVALRICLLPVVVKNRKELTNVVRANFEMAKIFTAFTKAQKEGKDDVAVKLIDRQQKVMNEVNLTKLLGLSLVQGSAFLSMAFALRGMATHHVESLTTGGLWWFMDLTVADPLYLLPLFCSFSILAVLQVGRNPNVPLPPFMVKFSMVLSPIIFVLLCKYETVLTFYFALNSAITIIQAGVLNKRSVREYLDITWPNPPKPDEMQADDIFALRQSIEELREREMLKKLEREREERKRSQNAEELNNNEEKKKKDD